MDDRELNLKIREDNLHAMQEMAYAEHVAHTETIRKVSKQIIKEMTEAGHMCVRGEQIARIETKVDIIIANQLEIKNEVKLLTEVKNSNVSRIGRLEVYASILGSSIVGSWAVFVWWFAEFKESFVNLIKSAHDTWK